MHLDQNTLTKDTQHRDHWLVSNKQYGPPGVLRSPLIAEDKTKHSLLGIM
jgi:hypothetical protein